MKNCLATALAIVLALVMAVTVALVLVGLFLGSPPQVDFPIATPKTTLIPPVTTTPRAP